MQQAMLLNVAPERGERACTSPVLCYAGLLADVAHCCLQNPVEGHRVSAVGKRSDEEPSLIHILSCYVVANITAAKTVAGGSLYRYCLNCIVRVLSITFLCRRDQDMSGSTSHAQDDVSSSLDCNKLGNVASAPADDHPVLLDAVLILWVASCKQDISYYRSPGFNEEPLTSSYALVQPYK